MCIRDRYYALNTIPIAGATSLSEGTRLGTFWHNGYFQSFPFYLAGAAAAWLISLFTRQLHLSLIHIFSHR